MRNVCDCGGAYRYVRTPDLQLKKRGGKGAWGKMWGEAAVPDSQFSGI